MRYKMPLKRRTVFAVLCLVALLPLTAAADQFLDACLGIAAARDKRLTVAGEQISLAKYRVTRSARGFFPFISAERTFSNGKTLTEGRYEGEMFGLRASQILFEGGRTRYTYSFDRMTLEAARVNFTKTREELFYKIKLAYYEMLSLKMEYVALRKACDEIDKLNEKVQAEFRAKAISELDLREAMNFQEKTQNLIAASEINLLLATRKMTTFVSVESLDDIPVSVPDALSDYVPEMSFTLKDCMGFIATNNLDVRLYQVQTLMSDAKRKINRSKAIPKVYLDGFYGKSGEAFVNQSVPMTTVWSVSGRLAWTLWGNTFEAVQSTEKTDPTQITDVAQRTESSSLQMRIGLFDDLGYFVDGKEAKVTLHQTQADYREMMDKAYLDLHKAYNDYENSLRSARQLKKEIEIKRRQLEVLRKRNQLYEVQTVQVMEETWKYADAISSYARAVYQNYASVTEMERLTLISLR